MGLINIVCAFSRYCAVPFTVEQVEVHYEDGRVEVTPQLQCHSLHVNLEYMGQITGTNLPKDKVIELLTKMGYTLLSSTDTDLHLEVPVYRSGEL